MLQQCYHLDLLTRPWLVFKMASLPLHWRVTSEQSLDLDFLHSLEDLSGERKATSWTILFSFDWEFAKSCHEVQSSFLCFQIHWLDGCSEAGGPHEKVGVWWNITHLMEYQVWTIIRRGLHSLPNAARQRQGRQEVLQLGDQLTRQAVHCIVPSKGLLEYCNGRVIYCNTA